MQANEATKKVSSNNRKLTKTEINEISTSNKYLRLQVLEKTFLRDILEATPLNPNQLKTLNDVLDTFLTIFEKSAEKKAIIDIVITNLKRVLDNKLSTEEVIQKLSLITDRNDENAILRNQFLNLHNLIKNDSTLRQSILEKLGASTDTAHTDFMTLAMAIISKSYQVLSVDCEYLIILRETIEEDTTEDRNWLRPAVEDLPGSNTFQEFVQYLRDNNEVFSSIAPNLTGQMMAIFDRYGSVIDASGMGEAILTMTNKVITPIFTNAYTTKSTPLYTQAIQTIQGRSKQRGGRIATVEFNTLLDDYSAHVCAILSLETQASDFVNMSEEKSNIINTLLGPDIACDILFGDSACSPLSSLRTLRYQEKQMNALDDDNVRTKLGSVHVNDADTIKKLLAIRFKYKKLLTVVMDKRKQLDDSVETAPKLKQIMWRQLILDRGKIEARVADQKAGSIQFFKPNEGAVNFLAKLFSVKAPVGTDEFYQVLQLKVMSAPGQSTKRHSEFPWCKDNDTADAKFEPINVEALIELLDLKAEFPTGAATFSCNPS